MSTDPEDGFRALAAAVLVRAIKDAHFQTDDKLTKKERASIRGCARDFMRPENELFRVYCGLLDYDPDAVAEGVKRNGRLVTGDARRLDRLRERIAARDAERG